VQNSIPADKVKKKELFNKNCNDTRRGPLLRFLLSLKNPIPKIFSKKTFRTPVPGFSTTVPSFLFLNLKYHKPKIFPKTSWTPLTLTFNHICRCRFRDRCRPCQARCQDLPGVQEQAEGSDSCNRDRLQVYRLVNKTNN